MASDSAVDELKPLTSSVSVIIPAYNAERYLREAIQSALNQARPAADIIVVDDASTDRTVAIARSYGGSVQVVANRRNEGPGARRNQGAFASTGDYIAFLDSDDVWSPNHLEVLAGLLDQHAQPGFAFSQHQYFDHDGARAAPPLSYPQQVPCDLYPWVLRGDLGFLPSSLMVRRPVFEDLGGFHDIKRLINGRRVQAEDVDFGIRLAEVSQAVFNPDPTLRYRLHPDQSIGMGAMHLRLEAEFRLRAIQRLRQARDPRIAMAEDRVLLAWESSLERMRSCRNVPVLRALVSFGLRHALYRPAALAYLPRALVGNQV